MNNSASLNVDVIVKDISCQFVGFLTGPGLVLARGHTLLTKCG
jgi:hypothetical protein